MAPQFLNPHQLAARWGGEISVRTLANWRVSGRGPRFIKIGGSILYSTEEVERWERSRTVQSTSEFAKFRDAE